MDTVAQLEAAAKLQADGKWKELQEFSALWAKVNPNNLFAWQSLGMALRKLGKPHEAIVAFRQGLTVVPTEPLEFCGKPLTAGPLLFGLAHAYAELGNNELAKVFLRDAARIDPQVVDIWNDLGVVCMNLDDSAGAFEAFKQAVALDDTNPNSLSNLGVLYAMAMSQTGVRYIHQKLEHVDAQAAKAFLAKVRQIQAR